MKKTAAALVEEAMAQVTTYTVEQARALHGHPGVVFVDIRDVRELEPVSYTHLTLPTSDLV